MQYHYPDLCAKIVARIPERLSLRREQQRTALQAILAADMATSIELVVAQIGITSHYLRKIHPDLYAQLRHRCEASKRSLASTKRAAFQAEIRTAVIDLNQRGLHPSRRRVFAAINNPCLKSTKILDRQIAATLIELNSTAGVLPPAVMERNPVRSARNHPLAGQ